MHVSLIGINHRTALVSLREKTVVRASQLEEALAQLRTFVSHGVILSTCNRTEIYVIDGSSERARESSMGYLKSRLGIAETELKRYAYICQDNAAIEHLFRLASGLDSMVLGECEILGQINNALEAAEKAELVSLPLRRVFQDAIRTGRRVRDETGISKNSLSVSSVAVELALKAIGKPEYCKMVVIGAGEAGRLVVKAARDRGITRVFVASRTEERASALAEELGGVGFSLDDMVQELSTANMVVTCADAPHWVLRVNQLREAMKNRQHVPKVLIDIAVPRNIEPDIKKLKDVLLYNIDDLTQICDSNRKLREGEIRKAEEIIAGEVADFASWWATLESRPLVAALMGKAEAIRTAQLNKTLKKLRPLTDEEKADIEAMTRSIVTKILQGPLHHLKSNGNGDYAAIVNELFQLDSHK